MRAVRVGAIALFALAGGWTTASAEPAGVEHRDESLAYALTLPSSWQVMPKRISTTVAGFRRGPSDTLSVSVMRLTPGASAADHEAQARAMLAGIWTRIGASETVQLGGRPARVLEARVPNAGQTKRVRRYTVLRDGIALTFEVFGTASDPTSWAAAVAEFEAGVRWLPGRPTIPDRHIAHLDARGGGWRVVENLWWSPVLDLRMDLSPYVSLMSVPELSLSTFLFLRDPQARLQFEIYAAPNATRTARPSTLTELYGPADPAAALTATVLGEATRFESFKAGEGRMFVGRIARPTHQVDLIFLPRGAPDLRAMQAMLDRLEAMTVEERVRREASAKVPGVQRLLDRALMFDGQVLRDRRAGLRWSLGQGEWQAKIGEVAAATRGAPRFMAYDARTSIKYVLFEYPDQTPASWAAFLERAYAKSVAQAPLSVVGQSAPVWRMGPGVLSVPFVLGGRYFIAESTQVRTQPNEVSAAARRTLGGLAPIEPGWAVTRDTHRFSEPWFALKVRLPSSGRLGEPSQPPELKSSEFLQVYTHGFIRVIAAPSRTKTLEALAAVVAYLFAANKIDPGAPTWTQMGRHRLQVWSGPVAARAGAFMRMGITYAGGVGLLVSHTGSEADWAGLLKGIDFMPDDAP